MILLVACALDSFENFTSLSRTVREKMGHRLCQSVICSRLTYVCHCHGILHSTRCKILECVMLRILKQ